ncbi:InlB B-repeat-containing protein, partial [Peptoniphilus hominis (ex Hitch et al. 2025)]
ALTKGSLQDETANLTVNAKVTPQDPPVVGPVDPTDPNGGKPADPNKYWTVTFKSADETKGTVAAKNTVYVLKAENKTLKDITAPATTAKTGYEFAGWTPALDANTAINENKVVIANFKATGTPTPQDPPVVGPVDPTDPNAEKPADPNKYWTVTFKSADETKGTVAAKNTVYVLKTENKTLKDITAPEKTAKTGYEFAGWTPALDANTAINENKV